MKQHTLALLVDNQSGVLTRVSSLFGRRGFNIDTLTVGVTEREGLSRITVRVTCDDQSLVQLVHQLEKTVCVRTVSKLPPEQSVTRELLLIKVSTTGGKRGEVMEIASVFRARVVDVSHKSLMLEMTGESPKINAFYDLLSHYGILELARTGITALARGDENIYQSIDNNEK